MSSEKEKIYFFDRPENVSRLLKVFYAICVLLVLVDFAVHRFKGGHHLDSTLLVEGLGNHEQSA